MEHICRYFLFFASFIRRFPQYIHYFCRKPIVTIIMKLRNILLTVMTMCTVGAQAQYKYPFQDPSLSNAERAKDLISRLTIEEKANLMMHYSPAVERLGIHQFQWWGEALHGVGFNGFATVFPEPIGMAASFNDRLLRQVYDAVSNEIRAKYNLAGKKGYYDTMQSISVWTPNVNIFRDPRWGRGQETYGEDPYLTSRMGLAVVNGLQGGEGEHKYYKAFACAKHFAVHSGPEWSRHTISIDNLSPRDFHETYLPAFRTLVTKGNVREVMCAYNSIDGEPCCSDKRLLQQILRDDWKFTGLVVSDCDAINDIWRPDHHGVEPDEAHASARAVEGGTDLNCGGTYPSLPEAVKVGAITEDKIDVSLQRLIEGRIMLGDFDPDSVAHWNSIGMDTVDCRSHQDLALKMAHETMTLLHNPHNLLPLDRNLGKVVVMGPNANDSVMQWGNYSGRPGHTVTILEGIRNKLGADRVKFIDGCGYVTKNIMVENRYNRIKGGMTAQIWNNTDMKGEAVASRTFDRPINFNLNEYGNIASGVDRINFSMQLKGVYQSEKTEDVKFKLAGDDGFRLLLNGDTIFNEWGTHSTIWKEKLIRLEAGKDYAIQIDYFQGDGGAELVFDVTHDHLFTNQELLDQVGDIETVVFVGGISSRLEGEEMGVNEPGFKGGDRVDIQLPQMQRDMLAKLQQMGKKVVFVNCSGSAIGLVPETQSCDAILQAWYPGEKGGTAVADVLFGDYNPSGKLPITFYRDTTQLPDFENYEMKNRTYRYFRGDPLYPFGYGLSYTTFKIGKAKVSGDKLLVTVKNTGKRTGDEVVQLYVRALDDAEGPIKSLRGFQRLTIEPGKTAVAELSIDREKFERFDPSTNTIRVVPGKYRIYYGTSSDDKDLKTLDLSIK